MLLSPIGIRPGEESEIDCNFSEADIEKKFKGMQNQPIWFKKMAKVTWQN